MFNEITTQWCPRNTHGPHAACVNGLQNIHPAKKMRNTDGKILRMSQQSKEELLTFAAKYTNPGAIVYDGSCGTL